MNNSLTSLVGAGIKKATCYIRSKMVLTDSDLIARAQDGDDEAFNELVCRHQDFVYRQALSYLQDCDSAKDAAQDGKRCRSGSLYKSLPWFSVFSERFAFSGLALSDM